VSRWRVCFCFLALKPFRFFFPLFPENKKGSCCK
jgi:hypothetical protein